jgi:hypothetical protein
LDWRQIVPTIPLCLPTQNLFHYQSLDHCIYDSPLMVLTTPPMNPLSLKAPWDKSEKEGAWIEVQKKNRFGKAPPVA